MNRARIILNLLNKEDYAVQETPHQGEASTSFDADKVFSKRDCYESAPTSTVSSSNKLPLIQQPHSAPLVTNKNEDNDLITLEDLIQDQDSFAKRPYTVFDMETIQQSADFTAMNFGSFEFTSNKHLIKNNLSKSPFSTISGIEPLCSSPVPDFSDSSDSWDPNIYDQCRLKKKRRIINTSLSSDTSDNDDAANIRIQRNKTETHLIVGSLPEHSDEIPGTSSSTISKTDENSTTQQERITKTNETNENQQAIVEIQESIEPEASTPATDGTQSSSIEIDAVETDKSLASTDSDPKIKDTKRWKKSCPSKWKKNVAKANKHNCLPYETKKGKIMSAKKPKQSKCETKCRYLCSNNFSEDERVKLCEQYWKITNYVAQKQFLLQLIVTKPVKTWKVNISRDKHRLSSNEFYFHKNESKVRVCKQFFLKTLCISNGPVNEAIRYKNEFGNFEGKDGRGSRVPVNKTSPDSEQKIIDHINSFPRLESHYCRKTTQRQYLESNLSIAKMYELYKENLVSNNDTPCSFYVYKKLFGTRFNLSFFTPKKDLCIICTRFVSADQPEHLKEEYDAHIARKVEAQAAKELDKQRSIDDNSYLMVTADMQSTLHIPVCGVGILYYTRKLNVQNYTIYTAKPPYEAYCVTWSEINGKRGSVEIASAINWWISQVPANVKEITMYSDTCAGQNRNQFITAFLVHLIQRSDLHLEVFEQKYLETGHTHMEVDSMHSAIEKEQRNTPVYSMIDWKSVMSRARSKRHRESAPPYVVKELSYKEMLDVKALNEKMIDNTSNDIDGKKIKWLKIKCLRFEKKYPGIVKFRYNHDGPYSEFDVFQKQEKEIPRTRKRIRLQAGRENGECSESRRSDLIAQLKEITIPMAYTAPLSISEAKKKDLLSLCHKGIIPQELHTWYKSLPTSKDVVDRLLEPDVNEESGEH